MSSTPRPEAVTLRIKSANLHAEAQRYGLVGDAEIAAHIGVNKATLYRLREGNQAPSAGFIALALRAFPDSRFGDLFDVVDVIERVAS